MIGQLRGQVIDKQAPSVVIDVHGVGYEVQASLSTFARLPDLSHEVTLYTHFVVREDAQLLYGFADIQERALFRSLIKVNGVGPKLALAILSAIDPLTFIQAIMLHDAASLVRIPGVGKKMAERLLIEMRDLGQDWQLNTAEPSALTSNSSSTLRDALSALVALGYKPVEANRILNKIENSENMNSETLIRLALQSMAKA